MVLAVTARWTWSRDLRRNSILMIVSLSSGKIKRLARQMLRGRWVRSTLIVVLAMLIAQGPSFVIGYLFGSTFISYALNLYFVMILGPVSLGLSYYFIELFRGNKDTGLSSFTNGFANWWNALGLFTAILLRVILLSFLLIVPGIIAALKYSQAFFVLADDPDLRPSECMARSAAMMNGNKLKLVWLELSFILWYMLLGIPGSVWLTAHLDLTASISVEQYVQTIMIATSNPIYILLNSLPVLCRAYVHTAEACFYDIASGQLQLQYDGQVSLDFEPGARDVYEISGFETREDDNNLDH